MYMWAIELIIAQMVKIELKIRKRDRGLWTKFQLRYYWGIGTIGVASVRHKVLLNSTPAFSYSKRFQELGIRDQELGIDFKD